MKSQKLDAGSRVVALGYASAASLAMDAPDVRERFADLLAGVAAQPGAFKTGWTFEGTFHSLGEEPEVPHREGLNQLFRALKAPGRDSLLKRLREVLEAILH